MVGPLSFEPWNCTTHRHSQSTSIARGYNTHILGIIVLMDSEQLTVLNWVINELQSWKKWCSPAQGFRHLSLAADTTWKRNCQHAQFSKLQPSSLFSNCTPSHIWWALCARHLARHCETVKRRREASKPGHTKDLGRANPGLRMRMSVDSRGQNGWKGCWLSCSWLSPWSISEGLANQA